MKQTLRIELIVDATDISHRDDLDPTNVIGLWWERAGRLSVYRCVHEQYGEADAASTGIHCAAEFYVDDCQD